MNAGIFIVSYEITTGALGAPKFEVHLTVSTANNIVNGQGNITTVTKPPIDILTTLQGDFSTMTVMPNQTSILVVTEGFPTQKWPPNTTVGASLLPNTKLRMVLKDNWAAGTANFSYLDQEGKWIDIEDARVTKI